MNLILLNSLNVDSNKENNLKQTVDDLFTLILNDISKILSNFPEYQMERTEEEAIVETVKWCISSSEKVGIKLCYDGLDGFWLNDGKEWRSIDAYDLKGRLSFIMWQMGFPYPVCNYYKYRRQLLEQFKEMTYNKGLRKSHSAAEGIK